MVRVDVLDEVLADVVVDLGLDRIGHL